MRRPLTWIPSSTSSKQRKITSEKRLNRSGEATQPCRTPSTGLRGFTRPVSLNVDFHLIINPSQSMKKLAKILLVSKATVRLTVHKNLGYQQLHAASAMTSHSSAEGAQSGQKSSPYFFSEAQSSDHIRVFSNERIFIVDTKVNCRNGRSLYKNPEEVPPTMKSKTLL